MMQISGPSHLPMTSYGYGCLQIYNVMVKVVTAVGCFEH